MDVVLNAVPDWEGIEPDEEPTHIQVYLGHTHLATIPKVGESRASHGDDSSYHRRESERVIEESIVAWVQPLLALLNEEKP